MKTYFNIALALMLFISACSSDKKETEVSEATLQQEYYHFAETKDPNFCDSNAILVGDCGLGDVYLSSRGDAIYFYFCMGMDSITYNIGTYVKTDSTIVLTFSQEYCYYDCAGCEEMDTIPRDPNVGKLHKCEPWSLKMEKLNCPTYDYCKRTTPEEEAEWKKYVLEEKQKGNTVYEPENVGYSFKKVNANTDNYFKRSLSEIRVLESFLKP